MTDADRRRANLRGIAWMLVAVGALSLMDACMKHLSPHFPAMQVAALRGLTSLPIVVAWVALSGGFARIFRVRTITASRVSKSQAPAESPTAAVAETVATSRGKSRRKT